MCGIAGWLLQNNQEASSEVLDRMTDVVAHRGPDDRGTYHRGPVGLGFRRLSIIDLSAAGHQPMSDENGKLRIIFNGEVYNFPDLRSELEKKGYRFKSRTDTEVVLKLYQSEGLTFIKKLRGMFAFAIWDEGQHRLILARDRAGKKPLYYYYDGQKLIFGSELKSLLEFPGLNLEYDLEALNEYFSFGYINAPLSIYKNVRKIRPGHLLIAENNSIREDSYWSLPDTYAPTGLTEQEAAEHLRDLLDESVRIRMISDVPIGAFLSGGIDSSAVVAFMARHSSKPVKTFSIGFEESDFNETQHARLVAMHFSTDHYEEVVRPNYVDVLENIIQDFDEPFGDSSALPTYIVSKITRQHVVVALSGDGGDELFGGYDLHRIALSDRKFDRVPSILKKLILSASKLHPDSMRGGGLMRRVGSSTPQARYTERFFTFNPKEKSSLFSADMVGRLSLHNSFASKDYFFNKAPGYDFVNQIGLNDFHHYLSGDILVKVDRMSMLNSLETRSPLLDHRIIEFAFQCSGIWKIHNGQSKYILKKALEGILPKEILQRSKMGFGVPIKHWFGQELYQYCRDLLNSKTISDSGIFNNNILNGYLDIHKKGKRDMSNKLWLILAFALFLKRQEKRGK